MNRQLTQRAIQDELARGKMHKKEFLAQIERLEPWGRMDRRHQSALLTSHLTSETAPVAESIRPVGYENDGTGHRQPCLFGVLRRRLTGPSAGRRYYRVVSQYICEERIAEEVVCTGTDVTHGMRVDIEKRNDSRFYHYLCFQFNEEP